MALCIKSNMNRAAVRFVSKSLASYSGVVMALLSASARPTSVLSSSKCAWIAWQVSSQACAVWAKSRNVLSFRTGLPSSHSL